jgi:hypothetical protein
LRAAVAEVVKRRCSMSVRDLASVVGKLNSLEPAFGPAILVGTRIIAIQVSETALQFGWKNGFLRISEDSRSALRRVSISLDLWNGHPIRNPGSDIALTSVLPNEDPCGVSRKIPNRRLFAAQYTLVSDASDTTVASYGLNGRLSDFVFVQDLLPHEIVQSSTYREMSAILKTLLCKGHTLRMAETTTLWWLTDSENVSRIFRRGSGDIVLMKLALQVLERAQELNLDLQPIWVSRTDPRLQKADALSKHVNTDDWSVDSDSFQTLDQWAGGFTIDLFASANNFKVARYFSYSHTSSCAGVDAFSLPWDGEVAYIAPPVALILRVVRKVEFSRMRGILLIPLWRGAKFWLCAFPDGRHLGGVFRSFRQLRIRTKSWGTSPKDAFAGKWVFFLALEVDSRGCGPRDSIVAKDRCFGRLFGKACIC